MRLSSMRYKNYTWPHNPETFVVEYRRQMAAVMISLMSHSSGGTAS